MKELYSRHFSRTPAEGLSMDGVSLQMLAEKHGTPLYVMSDAAMRETCREMHREMRRHFGENYRISFASKALCAGFVYRLLQEEGLCADVVSGGELYVARAAGFPAEKLHFNGNNKTPAEIAYALKQGIGAFVIDSHREIALLEQACAEHNQTARVYIRIKPGVEAHTHAFISTGQNDSKFGFGAFDGEGLQAVESVLKCPHLRLQGLHCHIGSQIMLAEPFKVAAEIMMDFLNEIRSRFGCTLTDLILGGGFGIRYMPEDKPLPFSDFASALAAGLQKGCEKHHYPMPKVGIEPGRSLVGPAGVTLYTVGDIKPIRDGQTYVAIDGGMTDNPRYALYQADYWAEPVRDRGREVQPLTIAGKCCESGDLITVRKPMETPEVGDVLCVYATGAYNYSMASNYNCACRPPIYVVRDGQASCAVRRQTYEDLISCDLVREELL